MYPNPAKQFITLQIHQKMYEGGTANIFAVDGKRMQTISNVIAKQTIATPWPPGIYYLLYTKDDWVQIITFKVE